RDPNEFVRAAVVNAFANLGPLARRHLSALIERLEDPDAFVRARTVRAIFAVGESEPQVTEALAHAVEDEDPMVVAEALQAMLELAARGVLEPLAGVVSEPNLRKTACDLLAKSEASTLRLILTAAKETSGEIQVNLLGLLTETMKSFGSVEEYKKDLASAEASVRLAALEALSLFGIEEATEAVIEVLKNDPVAQVRQRAAMLLGQLPKENVQRVLIHAAEQDLDPDVRETARSQIRISS
ncbi:MAG: hypothetical protein GTO55_09400, partial [Armatimonadetes bacterium]|nr:hypothetical protein [Armatimonadota bacterium]NIM24462.1 hypothetical protein [Armatimonadota bacterium]NIM68333.1 hypothetical protein [Armatimonadota bacterium]NIM76737.1 hypothetical protein [Armatimonadota bacterium]NIN06536.1 hypothetical protein [Armatimonadota bacterium]